MPPDCATRHSQVTKLCKVGQGIWKGAGEGIALQTPAGMRMHRNRMGALKVDAAWDRKTEGTKYCIRRNLREYDFCAALVR